MEIWKLITCYKRHRTIQRVPGPGRRTRIITDVLRIIDGKIVDKWNNTDLGNVYVAKFH